jgi:hypothetical protein
VTKLLGLVLKTLAKPVSKRIKHEFSRYEATQRLLIAIGQTSHQITSRMTIWSAGYKVRSVTPLEREQAMKTGSEFVGEGFILLVSGTVVVWEYTRSKAKETAKLEEQRAIARAERQDLQRKLHALDIRLEALEKVVESNSQSLFTFLQGGKQYVNPPANELVPIEKPDSLMEDDQVSEDLTPNSNEEKEQRAGKEMAFRLWSWLKGGGSNDASS